MSIVLLHVIHHLLLRYHLHVELLLLHLLRCQVRVLVRVVYDVQVDRVLSLLLLGVQLMQVHCLAAILGNSRHGVSH